MAAFAHLRREERLGLAVAVLAHVALVAGLIVEARRAPPVIPPAERMTVSLAEDVGPQSTTTDLSDSAQAAVAPVLSPKPVPLPAPTSVAVDRPAPKAVEKPQSSTSPKSTPSPKPSPTPSSKAGGASRLGNDFLKGVSAGNSNAGAAPGVASDQVKASIASAMIRQIKPYWNAPEGVDADKLVTILDFDLNPDGSLQGRPRLVRQLGITDSNRPQAGVHAERAIRAIQLAAPFKLPAEYYDVWKSLRGIRFDRNL